MKLKKIFFLIFFAVNFEFKVKNFFFHKREESKRKERKEKRVLMYCGVIRLSLGLKKSRV